MRRTRSGIAGSDIGAASGRRLCAPFGCASASPGDESSPAATRQRGGTRAIRPGAHLLAGLPSQALFRSGFIARSDNSVAASRASREFRCTWLRYFILLRFPAICAARMRFIACWKIPDPLPNPTRSSRGRFAPWCNGPSVERAARYAAAASPSDAGWFAGWGFKPTSALITSSGCSSSNHPITFWTHSMPSSLCLLS